MNEIISDTSKFTLKTSTCELFSSPLRTISISIAIGDGTETRSTGPPYFTLTCATRSFGVERFRGREVSLSWLFCC